MKRFNVINRKDKISENITKEVVSTLSAMDFVYDTINPELIICVGGDGTILHAFHQYIDQLDTVSFVGIHSGTLGFAADYVEDKLNLFFEDIQKNEVEFVEKSVLEAFCYNNETSHHLYALNEFRVENIVKTQHMHVYLNDEYLELFRGNGLCISGQYGSTAYNRSIGGAIIVDGIDLLQMTEISGIHHRHARSLGAPLIMSADTQIRLEYDDFDHALLVYDHLHMKLDNIHRIDIRLSNKKMRFAHFRKISYLDKLNALF